MAAVQPQPPRRAGRALLAGVVAVAHLAAFLMVSLTLPKEKPPRAEPPPQTFAVLPFTPPEPRARPAERARSRTDREKRKEEKRPGPASTTPSPTQARGSTLPATGSHGPAAGELADPYAVREALRGSVGCDMENLKLRPDEQARCDDRTGRWAKQGRKIGPAEDDPKRAAELAAEEDFQRRKHDWKTTNCGIGNAGDMKGTLGQMPPRRHQSNSDWLAENKDAC